MKTITRVASVLLLGSAALLAGCATEEDLAKVRTIAVAADQKADMAVQRSDQAGQRADMAAQRADQAGQMASAAYSEAEQAERSANAANAAAENAKGVAETVRSFANAHVVSSNVANSRRTPRRRVASGERG